MKNKMTIATLSVFVVLLIRCGDHSEEYKQAKEKNTIEAYQAFVNEFGSDTYADSARQQIQRIEYTNLAFLNKIEGYESFLVKYPGGVYSDSAKARIYELAFDEAKKAGSITKLEAYQEQYPQSPFSGQVDSLVKVLRYEMSDAGIKKKVLGLMRSTASSEMRTCLKSADQTVAVSNGYVTIKVNCVEYGRCKTSNMARFWGYHRQCNSWMRRVKSRVTKLRGVKGVDLVDLGQ